MINCLNPPYLSPLLPPLVGVISSYSLRNSDQDHEVCKRGSNFDVCFFSFFKLTRGESIQILLLADHRFAGGPMVLDITLPVGVHVSESP